MLVSRDNPDSLNWTLHFERSARKASDAGGFRLRTYVYVRRIIKEKMLDSLANVQIQLRGISRPAISRKIRPASYTLCTRRRICRVNVKQDFSCGRIIYNVRFLHSPLSEGKGVFIPMPQSVPCSAFVSCLPPSLGSHFHRRRRRWSFKRVLGIGEGLPQP